MGLAHCLEPIHLQQFQRPVDQRRGDSPLAQFTTDADGAAPLAGSVEGIVFGKPSVAKQAKLLQAIERLTQGGDRELAGQLAFQLGPAVFPGSQQADRRLLYLAAQAGASSTWGSSSRTVGSFSGVTTARTLASISAAMAGLSFRYWRTFSLPWPMRSLP